MSAIRGPLPVPGRASIDRRPVRGRSLGTLPRASVRRSRTARKFGALSAPPCRARGVLLEERSTRYNEFLRQGLGPSPWTCARALAGENRYASPRSLSIKSAAVPRGSRRSGQSSRGSPASMGGRITPLATSSSNRLRRAARGPDAGGTSSATTRPCAVTEIRSPDSIRRIYRLRLSFSFRIPVSKVQI
jgi:hypothetical protein